MKIIENLDLINYNSYRISANCAKAYFPEDENDIESLFKELSEIPKIILGNGNNIILSKKYYDEHFIIFNGNYKYIKINDSRIEAGAGATMLKMSEIALRNRLSGFEIFYDIPSSVGGAIVMNAGANGIEIKDSLVKVRYFDLKEQKFKEINKEEINFKYRFSIFQNNKEKLVVNAWFNLIFDDPLAIYARMLETKKKRWAKQPREYPNCGSVFKRPQGHFVGSMIEDLGLKGLSVGGAKISDKHAGFIINTGDATGKDILNLIDTIQKKILMNFGFELEIEQQIL